MSCFLLRQQPQQQHRQPGGVPNEPVEPVMNVMVLEAAGRNIRISNQTRGGDAEAGSKGRG